MSKTRFNLHLSHDVANMLNHAAHRPGVSKSAIADAALAAFLSGEADDRRDAAIIKKLDQMDRRVGRVEQSTIVLSETIALFILYYLTATGPLPAQDRGAAESLGRKRFERFVTQVADRLAGGKSLTANVIEELTPEEEDFFTSADFRMDAEKGVRS